MYFTVYILLIGFTVKLPVGKYENIPYGSYSSFHGPMQLLVRTEVGHIINANTHHHKDSNEHENEQILHLYILFLIRNDNTFILNF